MVNFMYDIDKFIKKLSSDGIHFFKINVPKIINDKNRTFLELYGLPNLSDCFIIEELEFFRQAELKVIGDDNCFIIGRDSVGVICIDISTGNIISIDTESDNTKCFMNSNLPDFFACLYLYNEFCIKNTSEMNEEEQLKLYKYMNEQFDCISPEILCSELNWWSEILEPLEYGMF